MNANRTQAIKALASIGEGWTICQWGRPIYVVRMEEQSELKK